MGERRGTRGLELWCRRMTDGYPGVKIENMTTSWRDGLAFCAIIHHFRPDLIDFSKLNKSDIYYNNELAFQVAERHLGIPALLDPDDMVEYAEPDRLSILTYLSQFYQFFESNRVKTPTSLSPLKKSTSPTDLSASLSSSPSPTKKIAIGSVRRELCAKCKYPVFFAERLHVGRTFYHRTCFRCARCQSQLTIGMCYETESGDYCCDTCPDEEAPSSNILQRPISDKEKTELVADELVNSDSVSSSDVIRSGFVSAQVARFKSLQECGGNIKHERASEKLPICDSGYSQYKTDLDSSCDNECRSVSDSILDNSFTGAISGLKENSKSSNESINSSIDVGKNIVDDKTECIYLPTSENSSMITDSISGDNNDQSEIVEASFNENEVVLQPPLENDVTSVASVDPCDTSKNILSTTEQIVSDDILIKTDAIPNSCEEKNSDKTSFSDGNDVISTSPQKELEQNIDNDEKHIIKDTNKKSINLDEINKEITPPKKSINKTDYPDSLNPFDEDEEKNISSEEEDSKNPFENDELIDETPIPPLRKFQKSPRISIELSSNNRISTNPFGDFDEEDDEVEEVSIVTSSQSKKSTNPFDDSEEEPESLPSQSFIRLTKELKIGDGDNISLLSTASGRKKKQAPTPPSKTSPSNSSSSSPYHSQLSTPRSTHKFRKLKKAPPPPPPSLNQNELTKTFENKDLVISTDIPNKTNDNQLLNDQFNEKIHDKNESHISSDFQPKIDKSTYGKWKRRKGQAPLKPVPIKRTIVSLPFSEIKKNLEVIEVQMRGLEKQGVTLEQMIRERTELPDDASEDVSTVSVEVDDMILQLFEVVNEKNELFRKQTELMYLRKQHRLEEEHADIEYQIRCLLLKPEVNKTDSDKEKEEELIKKLVTVVERRNEIVESLEMDRVREVREDDSINMQMSLYTSKRDMPCESQTPKLKEKTLKKLHKKSKNIKETSPNNTSPENEPKKGKKKKIIRLFKISH